MRALLVSLLMVGGALAARAECPTIPGAAPLLAPGSRVLVGEMHGTQETPRAVAALACHAAKLGPLRVALEIPAAEDARLRAFLRSKGRDGDRRALLGGAFWRDAYQDGRRSEAMLELLDALRRLRAGGADVAVVTFDASDADRDLAMAKRLAAAVAREPAPTYLALAGNLHARKTAGRFGRAFMAARLLGDGIKVVTLDSDYGPGSAWICTGARPDECGPQMIGRGPGAPLAVTLGASPDGAYDGRLAVGAPTFSPPAAVKPTAAQLAAAGTVGLRIEAHAAYDAKRYARCAARFAQVAGSPAGTDSDAYGAACCFARGGDLERAFAHLATAVEKGFRGFGHAENDPDLVTLRDDPRWKPLVTRMREGTN